MSLEIKYERPYHINEPEKLWNIVIKFIRYIIKSISPEIIITSLLNELAKTFVPFTVECEYQLDFRSSYKDKPLVWLLSESFKS